MKRLLLLGVLGALMCSCNNSLDESHFVRFFTTDVPNFKVYAREKGTERFGFMYGITVTNNHYSPKQHWDYVAAADFYAFSPADAPVAAFATNAELPVIEYTVPNADISLYVAKSEDVKSEKSVFFQFKPALAKLQIVNGLSADYAVQTVRLVNIANRGTLDLSSIESSVVWTPTNLTTITVGFEELGFHLIPQAITTIADEQVYNMLSEFDDEDKTFLAVQFSLHDAPARWAVYPIVLPDSRFKAGTVYRLVIGSNGDKLHTTVQ